MAFTYKNDGEIITTAPDNYYYVSRKEFTGSDGNDIIKFGSYPNGNTVKGGKGKDSVTGGLENSKVYGDEGDDYIYLTGTDNYIYGGEGDDQLNGAGYIFGDEGNDIINGSGNITGGTGDDVIYTSICHSHNTINYNKGDGNDTFMQHADNDTINLSGVSLVDVSYSNGLSFNLGSGTIKVLDAKNKFIHVGTKTYTSNGTKVVEAINNLSQKNIVGTNQIDFIYNDAEKVTVEGGEGDDYIYNSDYAPFATINGGNGNDTINDHSAASMVKYTPGEGNDYIVFHDTVQIKDRKYFTDDGLTEGISGRNNLGHYYGGGLLAIDGTFSSDNYNQTLAGFTIGGNNVKVESGCFTVREKDGDGFKYTRYWNGKKYNSYVYRDDERTTGETLDNVVAAGKGNFDNSAWSEDYATTPAPEFTDEADYIYTNFGTNKIFNALDGDDYIHNWGAVKSTINGGKGNDSIFNDHNIYTAYVTIDAAEGNDYIINDSHHVSIAGAAGDDTVYNWSNGDTVTIDGNDGNDYIYSTGDNNTISGGQGKDTVYNWSSIGPASIDGGTEDDYIKNFSSCSTINGGETGNDTILNYSYTGAAVIDGGNGNNYIQNRSSKSTVKAAEGNDTVYNESSIGSARIDVGDGNNFVYNNSSASTIISGKGKDVIYNTSSNGRASINSGDGNDTVFNNSYHATITGGAGNDSIVDKTANSMVEYNPGDGNDIVTFATDYDYDNNDNLTHYYGGGLIAINSNGSAHSYGKYTYSTVSSGIVPPIYTVKGQNDYYYPEDVRISCYPTANSFSLSVNGTHIINVGSQKITVNADCFTVREGTKTDNYKYTRHWAGNWTGKGITVKHFNSFVYLNDKHNEDTLGTYDDPHSADKYNSKAEITFTDKDDYVYTNFGNSKILNALDGDDFITNYGATKSTIIGGKGNDSIFNRNGSNLKYSCLEGKTTSFVTIDGGLGNDIIQNGTNYIPLNGYSTLKAKSSVGAYTSIVGGAGNDSVYNSANYVTIDSDRSGEKTVGGAGYEDYIYNVGGYASMISGYGNDTVYSTGTRVTIDSGVGEDLITNWGSYGSTASGDGKDTVYSHGARATIDSGKDDDIVYNYSSEGSAYIDAGDGHNYVYNNSTQSTIIAAEGNDTVFNNSTQVSPYIGGTTIAAGDGDNYIDNYSSQATITAGEGNDTIFNRSSSGPSSINSGAGADLINDNSSNVTINSGDGDDLIYNHAASGAISIDAGDGNDFAYIEKGDHLTFNGGAGNDIVTLNATNNNNTVLFNAGDGYDTVYGWQHLNGNDYRIFDETGKQELILGKGFDTYAIGKNRRDLFVKLFDDRGSVLFVDVLEPFPPFDSLIAVTVDNKTELNDKVALKDVKPNFYNLNKETQVFGPTGDKVTIDNDFNAILIKKDGHKSTLGSVDDQVTLKNEGDPTVYNYKNFKELTDKTGIVTVGAGVGTVVGSGWKSIGTMKIDELNGIRLKESIRSEILAEDIKTITRTDGITIKGNAADNWIVGGKGNDSIAGDEGDDTIDGGAGNDSVSGHLSVLDEKGRVIYESNDKNTFIVRAYQPKAPYNGGHVNQTTIVDYRESDDIKLAAGHIEFGAVGKSGNNVSGTVTFTVVNDGTNHNKAAIRVVEGYGKKINVINEDNTHCAQVYGGKSITVGNNDGETINTLWNPTVVTIDGAARQTSVGLIGNKLSNVIISGGGDDTIETGAGKDIIVYTQGNDVITDYEEGKDVVNLSKNHIVESMETVEGAASDVKDLIFHINNGGSLRINDAVKTVKKRGKSVETTTDICFVTDKFHTILSADGEVTIVLNESVLRDGDTIDMAEIAPIVDKIDTSKLKKKISLNIIGKGSIKGGAGNDTLTGDIGDDILTGGNGADVFVFNGGNDFITDYSSLGTKNKGDKILIGEDQRIVSASMDGNSVILTVGDGESNNVGTIQLNRCKNKEITVNDKTYTFGKDNATVKVQNGGSISDLDEFVAVIDASKSKTPVEIAGNEQNNIFKGGANSDSLDGGKGNDSLNGGAGNDWLDGGDGNDTLIGGKGNDIFVYNGGDDVITDYSPLVTKNNGDIIKLASGLTISEVLIPPKKKDATFIIVDENNVEVGTLKVNKGKGKAITINEITQVYNDSATLAADVKDEGEFENQTATELPAADMWFMPDDDCAVDELTSIIQSPSAVVDNSIGQLEDFNVNALAPKQNSILAFNRKNR